MHYIRKGFGRLLMLCGIIAILYFIFTLVIGVTIGLARYYSLALGVFLVSLGLLKITIIGMHNMQSTRYLIYKFLCISGNILLASLIVIEALVLYHAGSNEPGNTDYIMILGSGLKGSKPTLELKMRLNKGLECIERNSGAKIILSGGKGPDEAITEAEAMKRYLVENGVKEENILKEEKSTNTFENLLFTKELLSHHTAKPAIKVMVVTSDFHMFRARFLAERLGLKTVGAASKSPWFVAPDYYIREYFGVIKSYIFDRNRINSKPLSDTARGPEPFFPLFCGLSVR